MAEASLVVTKDSFWKLLAICLFLLPSPVCQSSACGHLLQIQSLEVNFSTQSRGHELQRGTAPLFKEKGWYQVDRGLTLP